MNLISRHYAASREWKRGEEESKKARSLRKRERLVEDNVLRVHVEVCLFLLHTSTWDWMA